tara:strand:+ start:1250 stop:2464 length:1215 start_codon:yes stop_codon:yes gene_type:complete
MAKQEKSVIEQALLEAQEIERTFDANAKEILSRTMGSEIEDMVKESLAGSPTAINEDEDDDMEMATDLEMGDELDLEIGDDDEDDLDLGLDMDDEDELEGDMDVVDLTDSDDEELIKVFKAMDPDSEIEVIQDESGVSFTDTETGAEYKVELGGGDYEMEDDLEMGDDEVEYEDGMEIGDDEEVIDLDAGDELEYEDEESEEVVYEIEISDDDNDEVEEGGDSLEEAPRTMSKLKGRKYGNPKRQNLPESKRPSINHKIVKENKVLKTNIKSLKAEKVELEENQVKMVGALKQFRQKLQEVAVFNSNLAHVVRLFTENTTTKEEKVDIVKRMDEATTLKESKMMFKNINKELTGIQSKKTIKESVEAKVNKTASTGSSQITESKVFENPELAKMKKMWEFNYKY